MIDENQAKVIAENFLRQHNSIIKADKVTLEDERVWVVEVILSTHKMITVKVNAKTGQILGYQ